MMCLEHHLTLSLSGNSFLPEELRVIRAQKMYGIQQKLLR